MKSFPGLIYNWTIELFNDGTIDQSQLEARIDKTERRDARPLFRDYVDGGDWGSGTAPVNPSDNFPILADLLHTKTLVEAGSPIKQWALDKLTLWIDHKNGNEDTQLPEWLAAATDEQGFQLFRQLARQCKYNDDISWDLIRSGVAIYGVNVLFTQDSDALRIAKEIDDTNLKQIIVHHLLITRSQQRLSGDEVGAYSSYDMPLIEEFVLPEDTLLLNAEKIFMEKKEREFQERSALSSAKFAAERLRDPKVIAANEAKQELEALLAQLKQ